MELRRANSVLVGSSDAVGVRLAQEKFGLRAMTVNISPFYFFRAKRIVWAVWVAGHVGYHAR